MRTRINPGKFNELNEYGIFHLSTLLLCISNLKPEETTSQEIARDLLKVTFNKASCSSLSSRSPIFQLSTIFHLNNSKESFFFLLNFYTVIKQSIGEKLHIELNSITKLFHSKGFFRYCKEYSKFGLLLTGFGAYPPKPFPL